MRFQQQRLASGVRLLRTRDGLLLLDVEVAPLFLEAIFICQGSLSCLSSFACLRAGLKAMRNSANSWNGFWRHGLGLEVHDAFVSRLLVQRTLHRLLLLLVPCITAVLD